VTAAASGTISSLQGSCPSLTFVVDSRTVRTTSATQYLRGSCNALANGTDVTAEGVVETDDSITATSVDKHD
jgi:hypothetical protein